MNDVDAATKDAGAHAALRRDLHALVSRLSHDLRTPLSTISGWLYLLESGKLDPEAQRRALAKIRANLDDQVRLIDDTLLIARARTGFLEAERRPVSPAAALDAASRALRAQAGARSVQLQGVPDDGGAAIAADPGHLQRCLEALIGEAIARCAAGRDIAFEIRPSATAVAIALVVAHPDPAREVPDAVADPRADPAHLSHARMLAGALALAQGATLAVERRADGFAWVIELPRADR